MLRKLLSLVLVYIDFFVFFLIFISFGAKIVNSLPILFNDSKKRLIVSRELLSDQGTRVIIINGVA